MVAAGLCVALGVPASASAQEWTTRELVTTVVIALPLTTTSYAVERTINRMIDKAVDKMVSYLEENEAGLRQGLAVGASAELDDLVAMCEVAPGERVALMRALRARRGELEQVWGQGKVTREGALRFLEVVAQARAEVVDGRG
jgi:hypothetical protein